MWIGCGGFISKSCSWKPNGTGFSTHVHRIGLEIKAAVTAAPALLQNRLKRDLNMIQTKKEEGRLDSINTLNQILGGTEPGNHNNSSINAIVLGMRSRLSEEHFLTHFQPLSIHHAHTSQHV